MQWKPKISNKKKYQIVILKALLNYILWFFILKFFIEENSILQNSNAVNFFNIVLTFESLHRTT